MISGSDTSSTFYRMTLIFYPSSTLTSEDVLAANSSSSYRLGSTKSLGELVSDFEPRVRKLAELVKPEDCFLWKIAHLPKLKSWVSRSGKVVLLGDAAHAMVPHLGAVRFYSPPALLTISLSLFDVSSMAISVKRAHKKTGRSNSRRRRRRPRRMSFPPKHALHIIHPLRSQNLRNSPSSQSRAYPSHCSHHRPIQSHVRRTCSSEKR